MAILDLLMELCVSVISGVENNNDKFIIPIDNLRECSCVDNINLYGFSHSQRGWLDF